MENGFITKYSQSSHPTTQLPARLNVTEAYPLQLKLWQGLKTSSASTMVAAQTPTLAKIKNEASETDARALLYIAICEVCDFFNVGKNMNDAQIALTVDLIIEQFWYFKLEEIKYCFRRAMMREKLFDRLDGNIILGWLREYDAERTEEAMRISEQEALQSENRSFDSPHAVSYDDYLASLAERAKTDKEAAEILDSINNPPSQRLTPLTKEEQERKEKEFRRWEIFEYMQKKSKK